MDEFEMKMEALMRLCEDYGTPESMELWEECAEYLKIRRRILAPEREVRKILLELGAPDHLAGHPYAVLAIVQVVESRKSPLNLSLELYPKLAEYFDTSAARVERAIRHLVEVTWMRGDAAVRERYFGNTVNAEKGKPTNAEFIARIANEVRQRLEEVA